MFTRSNFFLMFFVCNFSILISCKPKVEHYGDKLPEIHLLKTDSTFVTLNKLDHQKPLMVFYFSPYCSYCRQMTALLLKNYDAFKGLDVCFITDFPLEDMKSYELNYELKNYPNLLIGRDTAMIYRKYFKLTAYPHTSFYNRKRHLMNAFYGWKPVSEMVKGLKS